MNNERFSNDWKTKTSMYFFFLFWFCSQTNERQVLNGHDLYPMIHASDNQILTIKIKRQFLSYHWKIQHPMSFPSSLMTVNSEWLFIWCKHTDDLINFYSTISFILFYWYLPTSPLELVLLLIISLCEIIKIHIFYHYNWVLQCYLKLKLIIMNKLYLKI